MTLQARRTGSVNPLYLYQPVVADQVQGIPIDLSGAEVGQTLNSQNGMLQSQSYWLRGRSRQLRVTYLSGDYVTILSGWLVTTIGGRYPVRVMQQEKTVEATWQLGGYGGRGEGVVLADQTYHLFVIVNPSTGQVDSYFDTSLLAANRPSGWAARRVASVIRRSGAILRFSQQGDHFLWLTPQVDLENVQIATTATLYTLSVPTGLEVIAQITLSSGLANVITDQVYMCSVNVRSPSATLSLPVSAPLFKTFVGVIGSYGVLSSSRGYNFTGGSIDMDVPTNSSSQIQMARTGSYLTDRGNVVQTRGWLDFSLREGK